MPFIINRPLNDEYKLKAAAATLKSYQIFDYALNGSRVVSMHAPRSSTARAAKRCASPARRCTATA